MNTTPQTTGAAAVVTRGLTKYYGGRPVVHALNLQIPGGCVYGLLGRNGAGKSTAIRMLTGLLQADAGEAQLLGEDSRNLSPETRARIAYIAEGHPLYGGMTIDRIERFTRAFYPRWNGGLFARIIEHFELPRRRKLRRLSNGQRAQVSLALAVAPEPELLILDDPTLGLDTVVRRDFLESMIQIIQRAGRTILFSSHILGDVERVADRIGILVDGVLRVDCTTDHFRDAVRKALQVGERGYADVLGVAGHVDDLAPLGPGDRHLKPVKMHLHKAWTPPLDCDVIATNPARSCAARLGTLRPSRSPPQSSHRFLMTIRIQFVPDLG